MATLGANVLTLVDHAKRRDPNGSIAGIAELLSQNNEMLADMLWMEGNLPTGHRMTVRTSLPTPSWRLLNQGVTPSKSTTAQVDEACGMLEAWSEVDKDLAELNGNTAAFRLSEAKAFIEAMNQEMQQTFLYGNSGTAPEEITGFAPRFNATSGANGQNIVQVGATVGGGGSGSDNSSIWLVVWGEQSVFGVFPKGSKAGLVHEDMGLVTVETTAGIAGSRMRAYQDHFQWKCGLAIKDWRYVVRIPNIDISNLSSKSSAADLQELMIRAIHRIPGGYGGLRVGRPAFYLNRTCFQMLDIQRRDDVISGGQLGYSQVDGVMTPTFRGIPLRIVDQLTEAESAIS